MIRAEALVIGAGPAGLTAALYLARFRRAVTVLDAGPGRAACIPHSRNYPGFAEGVGGAALVRAMRAQAERYGARVVAARVEALERVPGGFALHWDDGEARAPTVLLATGASDIPPAMPHLAEALRAGVLRYCPVCDGYEAIGRAVGIVADSAHCAEEAFALRHYTERVTLFAAGVAFAETQLRRFADQGIALVTEPTRRIRLDDGDRSVHVEHGTRATRCDALYGALGLEVHSGLASALGALHDGDGYLVTDAHQSTSVPGLWAAGDVANGLNQIAVATGGAAVAATSMHRMLSALEAAPE